MDGAMSAEGVGALLKASSAPGAVLQETNTAPVSAVNRAATWQSVRALLIGVQLQRQLRRKKRRVSGARGDRAEFGERAGEGVWRGLSHLAVGLFQGGGVAVPRHPEDLVVVLPRRTDLPHNPRLPERDRPRIRTRAVSPRQPGVRGQGGRRRTCSSVYSRLAGAGAGAGDAAGRMGLPAVLDESLPCFPAKLSLEHERAGARGGWLRTACAFIFSTCASACPPAPTPVQLACARAALAQPRALCLCDLVH